MTEVLNTILSDSTYEAPEKRPLSEERRRNIREHLLPIVGGAAVAGVLVAGAAYDNIGPRNEIGRETSMITAGHGISSAAEQARLDFQAETGIEVPYSEVYAASQVTHGIADKNGIVQPGNIEVIFEKTPLLNRDIVTVVKAHSDDK